MATIENTYGAGSLKAATFGQKWRRLAEKIYQIPIENVTILKQSVYSMPVRTFLLTTVVRSARNLPDINTPLAKLFSRLKLACTAINKAV